MDCIESGLYTLTVWTLLFSAKIPGCSGSKHCIIWIMMSRDIIIGPLGAISKQKSTQIDPHQFYVSIVTFEYLYFATIPSS